MSDRFDALDNGEVISIQQDSQVLVGHRIFRVSELNDAIANYLKNAVDTWTDDKSNWFNTQGIDCEALRFGSNAWQKGRIRLCLEFCPDEANTPAVKQSTNSTPAVVASAPAVVANPNPATAPAATVAPAVVANPAPATAPAATVTAAVVTPTPVDAKPITAVAAANNSHTSIAEPKTTPAVGIAAAGVGVAAVAASAAAVNGVTIPNVAKVMPPVAATPTPAISDVVLEPVAKAVENSREGLDEIAFDFDVSNDNLGTMVPNGMMELDLSDLDLDRSENDYLDFENHGIVDPTLELSGLHGIGKPENSGMLIDEVWNEMSQPNWPGIH
jgi:hypothetical protein